MACSITLIARWAAIDLEKIIKSGYVITDPFFFVKMCTCSIFLRHVFLYLISFISGNVALRARSSSLIISTKAYQFDGKSIFRQINKNIPCSKK